MRSRKASDEVPTAEQVIPGLVLNGFCYTDIRFKSCEIPVGDNTQLITYLITFIKFLITLITYMILQITHLIELTTISKSLFVYLISVSRTARILRQQTLDPGP